MTAREKTISLALCLCLAGCEEKAPSVPNPWEKDTIPEYGYCEEAKQAAQDFAKSVGEFSKSRGLDKGKLPFYLWSESEHAWRAGIGDGQFWFYCSKTSERTGIRKYDSCDAAKKAADDFFNSFPPKVPSGLPFEVWIEQENAWFAGAGSNTLWFYCPKKIATSSGTE